MITAYVGAIGTEILLKCSGDISNAISVSISVIKPDGRKVVWDAAIEGTDSILHVTKVNELDMKGDWKLQGQIELPGWKSSTEEVFLTVARKI